METVRSLFKDACQKNGDVLVYGLLDLLKRGVVAPETPARNIPFEKMDNGAIALMKQTNALGFLHVKVYAVTENRRRWLLIAAASKNDAVLHARQKGEQPLAVAAYDLDFEVERSGRRISFRDMAAECTEFPALIGIVETKKT